MYDLTEIMLVRLRSQVSISKLVFAFIGLGLFASFDVAWCQSVNQPGTQISDADNGQSEPTTRFSEHLGKVQDLIESQAVEAKKSNQKYQRMLPQILAKKLAEKQSPIITGQSWTTVVHPGESFTYAIHIYNPDCVERQSIFAYVFVGPGNIVPDLGAALATADLRFSRLIMRADPGLTIPAGGTGTLTFTVNVPAGAEPTNYILNGFLFELTFHDIGNYLDRCAVIFEVQN